MDGYYIATHENYDLLKQKLSVASMTKELTIKILRRMKIGFLRRPILKHFFKKNGLKLQNFFSYKNDSFFIYHVNDRFIPNESLWWPLSYATQFEKCKNESLYFYTPKPGDVIVDLGAGLGEETIYFSNLAGESGKVIAVEANPAVFEILKKTISLNKLENVIAENVAIYQQDEMVSLTQTDGSYESVAIRRDEINTVNKIRGVRFDTFLKEQQINQIDFLKVNIEGGEKFVVDTINHSLRIRNVAIACHDFRFHKEGNPYFKTKDHVLRFLEQNGFELQLRPVTGTDYTDDWVYATNKF